MKFTRINDNSIRCLITREEMNEQGINLDELMDDRGKAEEFLRYVLQQARYEVDFETTGEALNVQLTVMKDGDVSLMISDDQSAAIHAVLEQFKERLKEFQEAIEQGRAAKEAMSLDPLKSTKALLGTDSTDEIIDLEVWAEIDTLDDCIRLAKSMTDPEIDSRLLKYHDTYYMFLSMTQSKRELAHNVFAIAEYSRNMFVDGPVSYGLEEHGRRIIKKHAIRELAEL